jgi:hypothetical protein
MPIKKLFVIASLVIAIAGLAGLIASATGPVDLHTWSQEGPPANGDWTITGTFNEFVDQSLNCPPTFYISPHNFIGGVITGTFEVLTPADSDYIGFVFGYQSPINELGHSENDFEFLFFDWNRSDQEVGGCWGYEGFGLTDVDMNDYIPYQTSCFWCHINNPDVGCDVLATDFGSNKSWEHNTEHKFKLEYLTDSFTITIDGGVIFTQTGNFEAGRFGFYNHSQPDTRYGNLHSFGPPPIANDDIYTVVGGSTVSAAKGVLRNDSASVLHPMTVTLESDSSYGILSLNPDGSFTYNLPPSFSAVYTFTYRAFDGINYSNVATAAVTILPPVGGHTEPMSSAELLGSLWILLATMITAGILVAVLFKRRLT